MRLWALYRRLSSDKSDYYRSDTALFTADLENLSAASTLSNLTLETAVYDSDSTLLFSDSRALADLAPGETRQETVAWPIAADVNDFDLSFTVQQQLLVDGATQPLQELAANVLPVIVSITTLPEVDDHYVIYTETPLVSLGASDTADIRYQWEAEPYVLYNGPFPADEGLRTVRAYPERNGVAIGPVVETLVMVDSVAPQTTVTLDPPAPNGGNGWYSSAITISLSAADQGVGVYQTQTSLDTVNWSVQPDSTVFGREGEFTLYIRSIDLAGNVEQIHSVSFKIDKSPPTLVHNGPYSICTGQTIELDGTASFDGLAGLSSTNWDLDGDGTFDDGDPASFTWPGGSDPYPVSLAGVDLAGNVATTTTLVTLGGSPTALELYPITLSAETLAGANPGDQIEDIFNGTQPGNFGWLTWNGSNSTPALITSLTPPGNSHIYQNPNDPNDHVVSVSDWVEGKPGVSNAKGVRDALDNLIGMEIIIPVWDLTQGSGANTVYRVVSFASIRLLDYHLPGQSKISAEFLGYATCGSGLLGFANGSPGNGFAAAYDQWWLPIAAVLPKGIALPGIPGL